MDEYVMLLIRCIFTIVAVLLTKYIIPILVSWYESNVKADVKEAVKDAVEAAEQTVKGSGKGLIKKEEVLKTILSYIEDKGYKIDQKTVDDLIEAAVFAMNIAKEKKEN